MLFRSSGGPALEEAKLLRASAGQAPAHEKSYSSARRPRDASSARRRQLRGLPGGERGGGQGQAPAEALRQQQACCWQLAAAEAPLPRRALLLAAALREGARSFAKALCFAWLPGLRGEIEGGWLCSQAAQGCCAQLSEAARSFIAVREVIIRTASINLCCNLPV